MRFERLRRWRDAYMMHITLGAMIFGLLLVYFAPVVIVTIPAGYRGVLWYRFGGGTDLGEPLREGTHVKFPWDRIHRYDARLQVFNQDFNVITKDGLEVAVGISVRFRVNPDHLGTLHKNVGPDYVHVMLEPEIGSSARVLISHYTAEEFYTTYRLQVQDEILKQITQRLLIENIYSAANVVLIDLDDVMIKSIVLPDRVASAIERKVEQYQQNLEYDFRLATERKEALRKQIEGEGVRGMFDRIGHAELGDYLRLAGIQATLQLATSPNSKVVVIGGGGTTGGLPLLFGDLSGPAGAASAPKPAPGATPPSAPRSGSAGVRPTLPPTLPSTGLEVPPLPGPAATAPR